MVDTCYGWTRFQTLIFDVLIDILRNMSEKKQQLESMQLQEALYPTISV